MFQDPAPVARVKASSDELRPVIQFALLTGMRVGEISGLDWERVDLEGCTARLPDTKTGKPRSVPLVKDAVDLLKAVPTHEKGKGAVFLLAGRRLIERGEKRPYDRYGNPWAEICEKAAVTRATFHSTRHTFASNYVMRGGKLFDLLSICGWSDYAMVQERYGHLAPKYLADSIGVMEGAAGKVGS